jgi:hypothetical protein
VEKNEQPASEAVVRDRAETRRNVLRLRGSVIGATSLPGTVTRIRVHFKI